MTSASYDPTCANPATCNQPNSVTDARGNTTAYTYDATHGGVLTVTGPAPTAGAVRPQTRFGYTLVNGEYRLTGISQCQTTSSCAGTADEVKTIVAYDSNGNVTSTSTGSGDGALTATGAMTWDAVGNLLTVDGPLPGPEDISRVRYNAARQAIGAVSPDPDGNGGPLRHRAVRNSYTDGLLTRVELGNVDSQSDSDWAAFAPAQAVETEYDDSARPVKSRLTAGGTSYALTQTSYDALGRVDCVALRMNKPIFPTIATPACELGTQGSGAEDHGPDRISRTLYDAAGRVAQVRTGVGITGVEAAEASYAYRPNGQVEYVVDGNGNRTQYLYDGHDRLEQVRYPSATGPTAFNDSTPATALATAGAVNPGDYEQPTYESLAGGTRTSNLVAAFRNRAGETIGFTYDALGRLTLKDVPNIRFWETDVAYAYDNLGRMTSASDSLSHWVAFAYDALGRTVSEDRLFYGTKSSQYDLAGRRTRLTWGDGFFVDYDYLVTGEMEKIRENGATSGIGVLATFGYDDLGRRISLTRGNGTVTSYGYDPVSRLSQLGHDFAGTAHELTLGFSYNPAGQIVSTTRSNHAYSWTGHRSSATASPANGLNQLASHGGTSLSYDAKGNLTSDGTRSFVYTAENRLAQSGAGGFAYDGLGRLFYSSGPGAIFDYDGGDTIVERDLGNAVTRRYVHGPGVDEPLVWYEGSGISDRRFLHADERSSIVAVSNASGNVTNVNTYDEYGKPAAGNIGRFQYTGQKWLPELGLYDYKNRMYHPGLPRFMQPDPIGYGGGMNRYAYVGGDPVNSTDPSGLAPMDHCTGTRLCSNHDGSGGGISGSVQVFADIRGFGSGSRSAPRSSAKAGTTAGADSEQRPTSQGWWRQYTYPSGLQSPWLYMGDAASGFSFLAGNFNNSPWASGDFLDHYFGGTGSTVQLRDIGLARFFENDPTVQRVTGAYISLITAVRVAEFHLPERQIGVSDLTSRLTALGQSAIYGESWCRYTSCFFRFSINDAFRDPLDLGFEIPGGTPYSIEHEWGVVARRRGGR